MDIEKIDEEVTADDGSDTYSAIHMFKITNTLDECCRESTNRKFSRRKSVKEYYDIDTVQAYAYKIYNDMTDDNTFIISKDKQRAKEYGKKLADIYRNYDEDTIDIDIDEYYNSLPNNVIVTNPEYWTDRKERSNGHWIVTNYDDVNYDDNLSFDLTIIGDYSDRF